MDYISEYKKNGFFVAKNLLDENLVKLISFDIEKMINLLLKDGTINDYSLFDKFHLLYKNNEKKYVSFLNALSRLSCINQALSDKKIINIINTLGYKNLILPTSPVLHALSEQLIITDGYYGFDSHQEWTSLMGSIRSLVAWFPITESNENFYPLEVVKSSHLNGIYSCDKSRNEYIIKKEELEKKDFISINVEPTDVVFMSSFTIHRSGKFSKKKGVRLACSVRYEDFNDTDFINRDLPTNFKRVASKPDLPEILPTKEEINKQFLY